jgi:hypothetical protein
MQEHPDDDVAREGLDRLFRKSAEEFDPLYDPAAWQLLAARLNEHDRVTAWGRILRWSLVLMALLVVVSGGWYGYRKLNAKPTLTQNTTALRVQPKQSLPIDSQLPNPTVISRNPVAQQPKQDIAGRQIDDQPMEIKASQRRRLNWPVVRQFSLSEQKTTGSKAPGQNAETATRPELVGAGRSNEGKDVLALTTAPKRENQTDNPGNAERVTAGQVASDRVTTDRVASNRGTSKNTKPARTLTDRVASGQIVSDLALRPSLRPSPRATQPGHEHRNPDVSTPDADSMVSTGTMTNVLRTDSVLINSNSETYRIGPVDALNSRNAMQWPVWSMLAVPAFTQTNSEPPTGKGSTPIRDRGLSIRVVVSPDLSAIGLKNFAKPGTNYGVLAEYRFNKRFSAQAGVIQSKKVYKATTEQYAWPANWKWSVLPTGVDAICDMLDIPINLRYDLAIRPMGEGRLPTRWFVSGGVTTYVMQREQYAYVYANPKNPWIKVKSWETKTGRYNFSNLNLSMGYERPIGRRLSWQVEPFLKMPLREVGYFKIHLLSTGAFLSVKYRL